MDATSRYATPPTQVVAAATWTMSVAMANHQMSAGVAALWLVREMRRR